MSELRELYEEQHRRTITAEKMIGMGAPESAQLITVRLHYDYESHVQFVSLFVDEELDVPFDVVIRSVVTQLRTVLRPQGVTKVRLPSRPVEGFGLSIHNTDPISVKVVPPLDTPFEVGELPFSGRMYVYVDTDDPVNLPDDLKASGVKISVRNRQYLHTISRKPRAFIAHDSRDKDAIARPIADYLNENRCPVWFDEYSMHVGDSLREAIEAGLRDAQFCIVVLSPNFLANGGWPKREYDAAFTKELVEDRNVILPVWHEISRSDLYGYSPILANRFALHWSDGSEQVGEKLRQKLKPE